MTETLDEAPPNAEELLVAWLRPLGRAGTRRLAGDTVPFRQVKRVTGAAVDDQIDIPVCSVHVFDTPDQIIASVKETEGRMRWLIRHPLTKVNLSNGDVANVSYCEEVEGFNEQPYGDPGIIRHVARYRIGLDFVRT